MYKKLCLSIFMILLLSSSAFSASLEQNFVAFENSINEVANKITWSGKYNFQDVEFVENEMEGDERVYARAWYDDYYLVIRKYTDKTWSKSYVLGFWTGSDELTFANGIKVGSSIKEARAFFGESLRSSSSKNVYVVYRVEESDTVGQIVFSTENNRITSISYQNWYNMTSKMSFLFSLYADLAFAEVTGEKVNVREEDGFHSKGKDKVSFQVSKSKRDCLLVYPETPGDGWCYIIARIKNNSCNFITSTHNTHYISKQFLKIRKLTIPERKLYFSQYLKE